MARHAQRRRMRRLVSSVFLFGAVLAQRAASSAVSVSFSFIHTNDMPVSLFFRFPLRAKMF
jgi:hypothetical protein